MVSYFSEMKFFAGSLLLFCASSIVTAQEVVILPGIKGASQWLVEENWWGEENRAEQLLVPRAILTGINPRWKETSSQMTVAEKKEVFYRFMLPLVLHANQMVRDKRDALLSLQAKLLSGEQITTEEMANIRLYLIRLRVADDESAAQLDQQSSELPGLVEEVLIRLDEVPAGLALGQAAYESGYGTSRFALNGNALFGQWTYGGEGMVPEQQRQELGDHRIASFEWPFDSVRGYFLNLMTHPAYEEFRQLRAQLREKNQKPDSLVLADGLIRYSERGQEYVDTLKGMIRVNGLTIADDAKFRDEDLRFIVVAEDEANAETMAEEIQRMRTSGELAEIVTRMNLGL